MHRTFLLELLQTLSAEDRREFELFLKSPYHNRGKSAAEVCLLYERLQAVLVDTTVKTPAKEDVFQQIVPDLPWDNWKTDKLIATLGKLLRAFLLTRFNLQDDQEFRQQLDFANILHTFGLNERNQQILTRLQAFQEQFSWRNSDFYFRQYQLESAKFEMETFYNRKKGDLNVPQVLYNLDLFYHLNRVELANFLLLQQKLTQLELPDGFEPGEVEAGLAQRYFGESSALLIEYQIFSLLRSPETTPEAFHQLADLLQQHQADIKKDRLEQYYSYLRNFCVLLIQSGAEYLLPVLHRLHRENLEHGFLYHAHENHLKLPPSSLLNMITVAIRVGKVDWACALLESHKDRIIGDNETRDLYRLNLACCLFASGHPDEALSNIPPSSPYADYHLSARRLEIKIYYEQASELLPYKVDAFKMFISRASQKFLSAQLRQRNADFANLVYQLMQTAPADRKRAERLLLRIQEKKWVADRDWLLEKARALG